jgi:hypothetical protein
MKKFTLLLSFLMFSIVMNAQVEPDGITLSGCTGAAVNANGNYTFQGTSTNTCRCYENADQSKSIHVFMAFSTWYLDSDGGCSDLDVQVAGANFNCDILNSLSKNSCMIAVLPVELKSFDVKKIGQSVELTWATASEKNNKGFFIERSSDAKQWQTINFIEGHGTTQEPQNYNYIDEAPLSGDNYYRLKQIDFDSTFEYSTIVNVTMEATNNKTVNIFPNPVENSLNIVNGQGTAIIYNALGQPVRQFTINNEQFSINTSDFDKGQYILQIINNNGIVNTKRFIK